MSWGNILIDDDCCLSIQKYPVSPREIRMLEVHDPRCRTQHRPRGSEMEPPWCSSPSSEPSWYLASWPGEIKNYRKLFFIRYTDLQHCILLHECRKNEFICFDVFVEVWVILNGFHCHDWTLLSIYWGCTETKTTDGKSGSIRTTSQATPSPGTVQILTIQE